SLLAACALLAATACSAGSDTDSSSGGSAGGGSSADTNLAIGFSGEPVSLDFTTDDGSAIPQVLLYNVYETLVKLDQKGEIAPGLAESWNISKDRKTYTFDLDDDAEFTNGHKFTAQDAVYSIKRVKNDWTISLKSSMDVVKKATAVSPTKLKVTLDHPSNEWLY